MRNDSEIQPLDGVDKYFSLQASDYQNKSTRLPWTWLRARELHAVRSLSGDVSGIDVLEFGAGAGFYARDLIARGARKVWAVDISDAMLAALPSCSVVPVLDRAETVRLDRTFAVLVSAGMLEFVRDPAAVMVNAARHADAGARFVVLAPLANVPGSFYRLFHRAHGLNIHLFDEHWFATAAPPSGRRVDATKRVFPFSLAVRLKRI